MQKIRNNNKSLTKVWHRGASLVLITLTGLLATATLALAKPYPLEYWALRDVISNVEVSPDGRYLAALKIPTKDGNPVIEIYEAANLGAAPYRVNAAPMEITRFSWVTDTNMVISLRQKVRDKIEGFNQGVYDTRVAQFDIEKKKFQAFGELNATISHILPNEPNKVILSFNPGSNDSSKIAEAFRPRSYYELDLKKGTKKLLIRGKISLGQIEFDGDGNPWTARGFDLAKGEFIWYVRKPGAKNWTELFRMDENRFEDFTVEGFDSGDRNVVFVTTQNGDDKRGLWEFDAAKKEFGPLVYKRKDVDVYGVRRHSNPWMNYDTIVGVSYLKDKLRVEYFDEIEAATYEQLEGLIPEAYQLSITSRSRDGRTLTVYNSGPQDPGTYYLLKDARLSVVGSKQPLIRSEDLAEVQYIRYKARDGLRIPAFLTVPKGKPPFPLVVLPHGGPFVEEIVVYDEWSQALANNGYLVLQPQYRGSRGYGAAFYTDAFVDGGQGGYKMQDDKDDGALHLVKKGLADADRVAMFGWSYGGYAALVAAARTPQIYQCVIAGAGVSDPLMQVNYYRDFLRGSKRDEQLNMWTDSVSPLKEAKNVNVPMLLIHGDVDQRVPPAHLKKYLGALERHNKKYRHVWLKGADHFSNTLFFEHQKLLFDSLIGYLKNECGPGGL